MLSDLERDRLENRISLKSQVRAINELRIRKKLAFWLDDLDDFDLAITHLPEDQIQILIPHWELYKLLYICKKLINIKKIYPVTGEIEEPEKWMILDKNSKRPAENWDIIGSMLVGELIESLEQSRGKYNPAIKAASLAILDSDPRFKDRITEGERKGIKRLQEAIDWFNKQPEIY